MKNQANGKDQNRDRVFKVVGRCKQHPDYQLIKKPTADCEHCRLLWRALVFLQGNQKD